MNVWVVTNLGGKNLVFQNYLGRLPIFFTKKEAQKELEKLNATDKVHPNQTRKFERKIIKAVLTYNVFNDIVGI